MEKMDIKEIKDFKECLELVEDDKALVLADGKEEKYAVITMNDYSIYQDLLALDRQIHPFKYGSPEIRLMADEDFEITYEEYENIKKQILEALDKTFKPKLEKLN